jgi:hypothetical protein
MTPLDVLEDELLSGIVKREIYHEFPGRVVCCLLLESGFSVIGVSGHCVDMGDGRSLALAAAKRRLWDMDDYMTAEAMSGEDGVG